MAACMRSFWCSTAMSRGADWHEMFLAVDAAAAQRGLGLAARTTDAKDGADGGQKAHGPGQRWVVMEDA